MDLTLDSASVGVTTSVEHASPPAGPPRSRRGRAPVENPDNPWVDPPQRGRTGPVAESSVALHGDRTTGLEAGYRRYLKSVTWAEADVFNAAELLELLLYFGRSGRMAASLAAQLLERFGSLGGVVAADPGKLAQVFGDDATSVILLKAVRAAVKAIVREPLEDRPVIGSASALMDYLSVTMRDEQAEAMRILFLDCKNALIKDEILFRGTVNHSPMYAREVIRRVIEVGATAIVVVHNHPSGDPTPSRLDIETTRRLAAALGTINVALHDHVIVGNNRQASFRKLKLI